MKKVYLLILSVVLVSITACTDESTFNNPVHHRLENGSYVRFETNQPSLTFSDAQNISFSDVIVDANNNTTSYKLNVKATVSGVVHEAEYFTTNSFPASLEITSQKLADAIGVNVTDFDFGDSFVFSALSTRNDGVEFNGIAPSFDKDALTIGAGNTEPNLLIKPAYTNAMNFTVIVSCPFVQSDIVGTYSVQRDDWADYAAGDKLTVTAGSTPDTFRILADTNPYITNASTSLWHEVTVNLATGAATSVTNGPFSYAGWLSLPKVQADKGLVLSCVGLISLELDFYHPAGGAWRGYNLTLQKD